MCRAVHGAPARLEATGAFKAGKRGREDLWTTASNTSQCACPEHPLGFAATQHVRPPTYGCATPCARARDRASRHLQQHDEAPWTIHMCRQRRPCLHSAITAWENSSGATPRTTHHILWLEPAAILAAAHVRGACALHHHQAPSVVPPSSFATSCALFELQKPSTPYFLIQKSILLPMILFRML